jgi:16S rRNA (guanine527-N7)-methyltransferase
MEQFRTYAELLQKWQKAVNLVAPDSLSTIWSRHFADSAQLAPMIGSARSCLDIGSGAGFPGMVAAIMLASHHGTVVHLVESNARKCAFLREVARQTGTAVEIHNARIEDIAVRGRVTDVDVVMARGVAPLDGLLALAEPYLRSKAFGLFLKGRRVEREIAEARQSWVFDLQAHVSMTDPDSQIIEIGALGRLEGRMQ